MPGTLMEFTEYHSPDGLIYKFDVRNDRFLLTESGYGMPPIQYITAANQEQHGELVIDYRLRPRTIQLLHRRNGCSRSEYWENRADILNLLRPNRQYAGLFQPGKLRKRLPDGTTRDIDVMIEQGPIFTERSRDSWDEWSFVETLRFIAHDPTFYNPTQVCHEWTLAAVNHLIFPFTFDGTDIVFQTNVIDDDITITYTGTWMALPYIQITGPISGPTITNTTLGDMIKLDYDVSGGETIYIDLRTRYKTVTNNLGHNLIGSVTSDSDLVNFHIAPDPEAAGGVNVVNVTGGGAAIGTTAVDLAYYTRYIGI